MEEGDPNGWPFFMCDGGVMVGVISLRELDRHKKKEVKRLLSYFNVVE